MRRRPRRFHRADAEGLVSAAFLEALGRVRPAHDPIRIAMYVRQETRRCLLVSLRRDDDGKEIVYDDVVDDQLDPASLKPIEEVTVQGSPRVRLGSHARRREGASPPSMYAEHAWVMKSCTQRSA